MPPGTYSIAVSANGFSEGRREDLKIVDGGIATVDLKLEIAAVEAAVTVTAPTIKPNTDPTYQQLRQQAKSASDFAGPFATVNGLVLKRDAATFTLRSGEIYFTPEVDGRTFGAVFLGDTRITGWTPSRIVHERLVRTFQVTRIFRRMTVLENMVVPVRRTGIKAMFWDGIQGHERERAERLLDFVGLLRFLDEPAGHLSFGQQKLLELAAALMAEPPYRSGANLRG